MKFLKYYGLAYAVYIALFILFGVNEGPWWRAIIACIISLMIAERVVGNPWTKKDTNENV